MKGNEIIECLRSGKRVYGTLTVSASPMWPKVVKSLDLDFVFIDTEHIPIDRNQLSWICNILDEPVEVYHVRRIKVSIAIIIVNPFIA